MMKRELDEIEAELKGVRTLKVRIRDNAKVGQDHGFFTWHGDTVFDATGCFEQRKRLTAPGYGLHGDYGNGALYVDERDLIPVEPERVKKPCSYHPLRVWCTGEWCSTCGWSKGVDSSWAQRMGMVTWEEAKDWFVVASKPPMWATDHYSVPDKCWQLTKEQAGEIIRTCPWARMFRWSDGVQG